MDSQVYKINVVAQWGFIYDPKYIKNTTLICCSRIFWYASASAKRISKFSWDGSKTVWKPGIGRWIKHKTNRLILIKQVKETTQTKEISSTGFIKITEILEVDEMLILDMEIFLKSGQKIEGPVILALSEKLGQNHAQSVNLYFKMCNNSFVMVMADIPTVPAYQESTGFGTKISLSLAQVTQLLDFGT